MQKNEAAWRVGMGWSPGHSKRKKGPGQRCAERAAVLFVCLFVSKGTYGPGLETQRSPHGVDDEPPRGLPLRSRMKGTGGALGL